MKIFCHSNFDCLSTMFRDEAFPDLSRNSDFHFAEKFYGFRIYYELQLHNRNCIFQRDFPLCLVCKQSNFCFWWKYLGEGGGVINKDCPVLPFIEKISGFLNILNAYV